MTRLSSYGFKLCIALAVSMIVLTVWMIVTLHFSRALVFGLCAACELCGASLFAEVMDDGSRGGRKMKTTIFLIMGELDEDGGFGGAIPTEFPIAAFTDKIDADEYVSRHNNPVVYDTPYSELYEGGCHVEEVDLYKSAQAAEEDAE